MPSLRRKSQYALAGCLFAAASLSAQAEIVMQQGNQGPKPNLNEPAPPALQANILTAQALFSPAAAPVTELGGTGFEVNPGPRGGTPNPFTYNGGQATATFSGGATVKYGDTSTPANGRYNMTPVANALDPGHWIEATSSFTISFTEGISAFSFFATDLGDFDGHVFLELYAVENPDAVGNNAPAPLFRRELINNEGVTTVDLARSFRVGGNGNLLYAGITSDDSVTFRSARFVINQCDPDLSQTDSCEPNSPDVVGFDNFFVGRYTGSTGGTPIPEPTSLALVGLGLLAAGWSRKAKRAA